MMLVYGHSPGSYRHTLFFYEQTISYKQTESCRLREMGQINHSGA